MMVANEYIDPVLLCNDLGTKRDPGRPGAIVRSNGHASMSLKEAVRIAQSNNFMGLMCNYRLLVWLLFHHEPPAYAFLFMKFRNIEAALSTPKTADIDDRRIWCLH